MTPLETVTGYVEPLRNTRPLLDKQFDALAHVERRRLLLELSEDGSRGGTPIEIGRPEDDGEPLEWQVEMRHNHLPKLEDMGFVRWNREDSLVFEGPQFENIEPLLAFLTEYRDELPTKQS